MRAPAAQFLCVEQVVLLCILSSSFGGLQAASWERTVPIDVAGKIHHRSHTEKARYCIN